MSKKLRVVAVTFVVAVVSLPTFVVARHLTHHDGSVRVAQERTTAWGR